MSIDAGRPRVTQELRDVGAIPPVIEQIRLVWTWRPFIIGLARDELRASNMHTFLGNLWQILNPVLQILVYWLVFDLVLDVSRGTDNFITFLASGIFFYRYTQVSLTQGAGAIQGNGNLVRSIAFPRLLLPVTSMVKETLASASAFGVMLVVLLVGGETPSLRWLGVVPLLALQFVFNLGGTLILARLANRFPDVRNFLSFFFRLLLYGTGVLFVFDNRIESPAANTLIEANPLFGFINAYRWTLLDMKLNSSAFAITLIWTPVLLAVGLWYFRNGEEEYGRL